MLGWGARMPQLGRYEILQRIARGSIADVLLARSSGLEGFQRHVVIKQIRPEHAIDTRFVTAFLDEARIGAALHHHNIVQVFDIDEHQGGYFFAMEYVHGEDLRRVLAKVVATESQVPVEQIVAIGAAAAAGLHHAHEHHGPDRKPLDLVHRDVSPSNILIGYDGSVKLVDFGLAKPALSSQNTRAGALGKAPYMSPELCLGKRLDRRSDLFALGTVLYELATARRLFKGANDYHTMAMIVEAEVPRPSTLRPELPRALDEIIQRCLAKAPEDRYQTAYDLRNALEAFAVDAELRTSAKSVADYLASLFGARVEPWHLAEPAPEADSEIDFDARRGVITTPPHGVELIRSLTSQALTPPILLAHEVVAPSGPFDEHPTRLDLPPDREETATLHGRTPAPPVLPAPPHAEHDGDDGDDADAEDESDAAQTLDGSKHAVVPDSTTTAAQPIVDELLTGEHPTLSARAVHLTAQSVTISDGDPDFLGSATGLTTDVRTLEDAFPHGEAATIKDPPRRPPIVIPPRIPATLPKPRAALRDAEGAGPVDEETTIQPPLFPAAEPLIVAAPPEHVYIAPSPPMPPLKRWGLVGAVLLIPLTIGLLTHACRSDRPTAPALTHASP